MSDWLSIGTGIAVFTVGLVLGGYLWGRVMFRDGRLQGYDEGYRAGALETALRPFVQQMRVGSWMRQTAGGRE